MTNKTSLPVFSSPFIFSLMFFTIAVLFSNAKVAVIAVAVALVGAIYVYMKFTKISNSHTKLSKISDAKNSRMLYVFGTLMYLLFLDGVGNFFWRHNLTKVKLSVMEEGVSLSIAWGILAFSLFIFLSALILCHKSYNQLKN